MGAVDISDGTALAADDMVVVVTDAQLEQRRRTGRLDTPGESDFSQCPQHVVDRLGRHASELTSYVSRDAVNLRVRCQRESRDHGDPGAGDAHTGAPQQLHGVLDGLHDHMQPPYLESFKIRHAHSSDPSTFVQPQWVSFD